MYFCQEEFGEKNSELKSFCAEWGSVLPNIQMDGALLVHPANSDGIHTVLAKQELKKY
jgi:hypothetical protein